MCPDGVRSGFTMLMDLFKEGEQGVKEIVDTFRLCPGQSSKPYLENQLIAWARNAFTLLAMVDYPYPAKFMADLPGHPVNIACGFMKNTNKLYGLSNITGEMRDMFLIVK